ncbi:rod shape-determining protein MreD [Enterococcus florum]|uniref:Rod shape-determining protein MreD n=1 Tax=Enterococcus florum TaxID=2480627 RepID=A0A4P5PTG4_9ENTE|nr:rod shape-determining protein MreD [Enterococcus florum]GCF95803.1 rod shape-determining protein MreD [Enterococcus florum]
MIEKRYLKYAAPFLLFFSFLFDTHATRLMTHWTDDRYIANLHLLILLLLVLSEVLEKGFLMKTMIVLGIVYDLYYIGIIGIYAVIFPVLVALIYFFKTVINKNLLTLFFSMIILVTLFELGSLTIQLIFQLVMVDNQFFVTRFLGPTLLLNMIAFVIFILPLQKVFLDKSMKRIKFQRVHRKSE